MCGIAGQYNFVDQRPVERAAIEAMTRAIAHRGPDDEGFHYAEGLGLGFRRLSIIDLEGGHQPMFDDSGQVCVVFNGEIYNFADLRSELAARGCRFRTRSDTEVIVHGYRVWGDAVLGRLNGMFGLAIWDACRRRLVLARDAAGIKLVYYRVHAGSVWFGSELRAVLAGLPERPALDTTALNLFLRHRYTPSPYTLFDGVRKLAPGTMAVFEDGAWCTRRWYAFQARALQPPPGDDEAAEALLGIYRRALQRQLVADVPVGLLLSGGLDSGLLLALMRETREGWPTYTVGYGKRSFADDELAEAAETAKLFGARHTAVELTRGDFERELPRIVRVLEEPVAASSIVPMYFVCQRARADVKVALVGQGPDELFGGYTRHLGVRYGAAWRALPRGVRGAIAAGLRRVPRHAALKRGLYALDVEPRAARFQHILSILPGERVDALFRTGALAADAGARALAAWRDIEPEMEGADELGAFQTLELRSTLPDELLMYADKLSMAHGLEVRVPYLDREVTEYVQRLPARMKVRGGQRKWLHRKLCERYLPPAIVARKKRGFAVNVVDDWFKDSVDSRMADQLCDPSSLMYRVLDPAAVQALVETHRAGREDHHKILFSLVVFEEWLRAAEGAHA